MPTLHENSEFDVAARMHAFVAELEREALDEDMVGAALQQALAVLDSRVQVAREICARANAERVMDQRNAKLKSKVKGVKHIAPGDQRVQLAISGRAH